MTTDNKSEGTANIKMSVAANIGTHVNLLVNVLALAHNGVCQGNGPLTGAISFPIEDLNKPL